MRYMALVLEDSNTQATIVRRMIEAQGWSVLHLTDVKAAMDAVQMLDFRAMFLDVYLGERNTLKHFDRFRMLASKAIIALMTAGSKQTGIHETLSQARKYEADYLLPKPFSEPQIAGILAHAETGCVNSRRHILVIDDSRTVCLYVKSALEEEGYRVSTAKSVEEAIFSVDIAQVDLVLCDIFMPGMGGLKGMRAIRGAWQNVKIIAMSGGVPDKVSSTDALNFTRRMGIHGQIRKPFDRNDLIRLIEQVFDPVADAASSWRPEIVYLCDFANPDR